MVDWIVNEAPWWYHEDDVIVLKKADLRQVGSTQQFDTAARKQRSRLRHTPDLFRQLTQWFEIWLKGEINKLLNPFSNLYVITRTCKLNVCQNAARYRIAFSGKRPDSHDRLNVLKVQQPGTKHMNCGFIESLYIYDFFCVFKRKGRCRQFVKNTYMVSAILKSNCTLYNASAN